MHPPAILLRRQQIINLRSLDDLPALFLLGRLPIDIRDDIRAFSPGALDPSFQDFARREPGTRDAGAGGRGRFEGYGLSKVSAFKVFEEVEGLDERRVGSRVRVRVLGGHLDE